MNPTTLAVVRWLEDHLRREATRRHWHAQFQRFIWSLIISVNAVMAPQGWRLHWSDLSAITPPILWVLTEEVWPSVPWSLVQEGIAGAKEPPVPGYEPGRISELDLPREHPT